MSHVMIRNLDYVRKGLDHLSVDVGEKDIEQAIVYEAGHHFLRDGETFMARCPFYHDARKLGFHEEGLIELDVVLFLVKDREENIEDGEPIYVDYIGIFDVFIAPLDYQEMLEPRADEKGEMNIHDKSGVNESRSIRKGIGRFRLS